MVSRDKIGPYLPLSFGKLGPRRVYGGPFLACPAGVFSVKMAAEIDAPCDVDVKCRDFNVPADRALEVFHVGIARAIQILADNRESVYVGCRGGVGRTGLFLSCLAKTFGVEDPVSYVRLHFNPHAVETVQQREFVQDFHMFRQELAVQRMRLSRVIPGTIREYARRIGL